MSETKWTPAPWSVEFGVVIANDEEVAHVVSNRLGDALLIAAAPELYEALNLLLVEVDASAIAGADDFGWPNAVTKSRAALAKARGES